jgi:DNA-directed RNA polymerase specialized sigma24 family protein
MSSDESITTWLGNLQACQGKEETAAQRLFERYFVQLEQVARGRLAGLRLHDRDEQDVAIVAMEQFFLGVRQGRFPRLRDRHDLWQVLLMILERRLIDEYRRKPEPVCGESALHAPGTDSQSDAGFVVPALDPRPDMIVQMAEELAARLSQLPERLRPLAIWKLEGRTNAEIAKLIGRSEKRVEAKLKLIREIWLRTPLPSGLT